MLKVIVDRLDDDGNNAIAIGGGIVGEEVPVLVDFMVQEPSQSPSPPPQTRPDGFVLPKMIYDLIDVIHNLFMATRALTTPCPRHCHIVVL